MPAGLWPKSEGAGWVVGVDAGAACWPNNEGTACVAAGAWVVLGAPKRLGPGGGPAGVVELKVKVLGAAGVEEAAGPKLNEGAPVLAGAAPNREGAVVFALGAAVVADGPKLNPALAGFAAPPPGCPKGEPVEAPPPNRPPPAGTAPKRGFESVPDVLLLPAPNGDGPVNGAANSDFFSPSLPFPPALPNKDITDGEIGVLCGVVL